MSTNSDHTEDVILAIATLSNHLLIVDKKLNDLFKLTNQIASHLVLKEAAVERTRHEIDQVERYTSNSGNTTWKGFNQDDEIIYLRQAHKALLESAGLWDSLNAMPENERYAADIILYTVPDGDFKKPVEIEPGGWVVPLKKQVSNPGRERLKALVESGEFVVLDTETTDLDGYVCQIAVLDSAGQTLLNTLVKPPVEITAEATAVHGITNEMVADAPTMEELVPELGQMLERQTIVGWNVEFDITTIDCEFPYPGLDVNTIDAMGIFALIYGEWNEYRQNYKWQKLTTAATYYDISTNGAHSALADCQMTLEVVKKMVTES